MSGEGDVAEYLLFAADLVVDGVVEPVVGEPSADGSGSLVGVPAEQASGTASAVLAPRGPQPLTDGARWRGPAESRGEVVVRVHLPDHDALRALQHATTTITIKISGESR
ncbi:hypothetical protein ET495_15200 [Xylanimonas allomyrinae]|uniref:Uncharacterized protein n=1 Tax=Xylanimonas allomyrinae TaxID=2509459 RepID=A0A4P6ES35_9MICO|nr:hypothetical protein ET495_15200 [Xylanimonas allomyrinae]